MDSENSLSLLESIFDMVTVLDADGTVRYQSPWCERTLGYPPEELNGENIFAYIHPEDQDRIARTLRMLVHNPGKIAAAELRFRHHDGSWQFLQASSKSLRDSSGAVRVVVTADNITARKRTEESLIRRNLAERKRTEEALRESEEKYRDLVENINDVIYTHDEAGRITYISPVIALFEEASPAEVIGHSFTEFVHPEDLPALLESAQRTLAGHLEPSEFRIVTKSGAIRWIRSSSRPIVKDGRAIGMRGVITDITERKQAEQRTAALLTIAKDVSGTLDLHELLDRVQRSTAAVLPCNMVATFYWDPPRERFRMISQYGIPPTLLPSAETLAFRLGEPFGGLLAVQEQTVVINDVAAQPWLPTSLLAHFGITALIAAPLRVRGHHLGGFVACTLTPGRRFDTHQVELCSGIARQLAIGIEAAELYTQQQEEARIASALARVGQELIASLDMPSMLERLGRLTTEALEGDCSCTFLWQPQDGFYTAVASWGYTPEQQEALRLLRIPQKILHDLVTRLEQEEVIEMSSAASQNPVPETLFQRFGLQTALFLCLRRGQEQIGLQVCGYHHQKEIAPRHLRIARGIAQVASLALVNARLVEELGRANRLKEEFLGTMSHELRTPLHIILGYNQLMREGLFGLLTTEQGEVLGRIGRSATELLDLIQATLDLSRLQNQQVPLTLEEVHATDLLWEIETELRPLSHKSTVTTEWQVAQALPALHTDRIKLKMVLKNLIMNALKFTDEGVVSTGACTRGDGVEFVVSDTGIGIAPDALAIIFEPFRQVDGSSTRRHGGVGLGLYIVRQLLDLLEGSVSVESAIEKGSTFRVWIPQRIRATRLLHPQ